MGNWTGLLQVRCEKRGKKSILKDSYHEGAFKITRPVYLDDSGQVCLYVMNPGGGYVEGDSYRLEVDLEPGAEVLLTTQSSTKIYKTAKRPVIQEMEIMLKEGSVLEYFPDPVIAYQNARFKQDTVVYMERGASLVAADIFTPGWAPDGSWFRYDLLQSRLRVYMEGRLIVHDHLKLEPIDRVKQLGSMEEYTHLGSMILIHDSINQDFVDELYDLLQPFNEGRIGLSLLSVPGMSIRMMADRTQQIEGMFGKCHQLIRERMLGKESVFLRKY